VEELDGVAGARWSTEHKEMHANFNDSAPSMLTLPAPPGKAWDIVRFSHTSTLVGAHIPWDENSRTKKPHLVWRSTENAAAKNHPLFNASTLTKREDLIHSAEALQKSVFFVNGEKVENVMLKLRGKTVSEVSSQLEKVKAKHQMKIIWGASKVESEKNIRNLAVCFLIAAVAILIILYWQNRSAAITLVIMCTFIWGLIGAFPGLLIHKETLNSSAIVGFILLAGTIVNNGILLMELIVRSRNAQQSPAFSCYSAVSQRTLPVLITALTTAVGMLPMVWDTGEGSQMYRALSIVVVYGTVVSTPVSLLGIPSIYLILYDAKEIFGKIRLRLSVLLTTKTRDSAREIS
jgi:predicted RND superfamily exporter protein